MWFDMEKDIFAEYPSGKAAMNKFGTVKAASDADIKDFFGGIFK